MNRRRAAAIRSGIDRARREAQVAAEWNLTYLAPSWHGAGPVEEAAYRRTRARWFVEPVPAPLPPVPTATRPPAPPKVDRLTTVRRMADRCTHEIVRRGELEPCDRIAVAVRIDPEEGLPYPVCNFHARPEMVPLTELLG